MLLFKIPRKNIGEGGGENDVTFNGVILPVAYLGFPCSWGQNIFVSHQQKL